MPNTPLKGEKSFRGIPVSGGICRGKILVLGKAHLAIPHRVLTEQDVPQELHRLEQALVETRKELREVQQQVTATMGAAEGSIFDAHLMVLEDPVLMDEVTRLINLEKHNAEHAFHTVAAKYAEALARIEDNYLRERAADMRDVATRVINNLLGRKDEADLRTLKEPCIIVSHDLSPSTTAQLDRKIVLGFATDAGGPTSHTAIMARSLDIPAVVGLQHAAEELESGELALLDGYNGIIIVNPSDRTLFEYGQLIQKKATLEEKLREILRQPAVTLDGRQIILSANIEHAGDTEAGAAHGPEGVGLFRTEYLFLNRTSLPDEEEQFRAYRQAAAAVKPQPLVIRTLDLGGDKFDAHLQVTPEMNPFLGWRAIRFCLEQRDLFRAQLRAVLRASTEGNVKLMFPMISGLDELNQTLALVEEYRSELRAGRIPFDENMEIGAMIEIPSAALVAEALAKRLDFFSIGTNDLIQYSLAADRTNERVAHLYEPTHPAIVRLIKMTVDAARKYDLWVGVCGELAGDPAMVPLLLGLGVDELSAAPGLVPEIKFLIRRLRISEAQELAEFALNCESTSEILARARALAQRVAPSLFENKT